MTSVPRTPKCSYCGEPIKTPGMFEWNDKRVHWDCVRQIVSDRLEEDERTEFLKKTFSPAELSQ